MNINNKIFAYIKNKESLTESMKSNYKDALILVGDENQLYNPLTNTWVGIGNSSYNHLSSYILNAYNGLSQEFKELEYVISMALNDLNTRVNQNASSIHNEYTYLRNSYAYNVVSYNNLSTYTLSAYTYILNAYNGVREDFEELDYVTSAALNDLNTRVSQNTSSLHNVRISYATLNSTVQTLNTGYINISNNINSAQKFWGTI